MDVFLATQLSIPVLQIVLLLGLSTLAMVFGRVRLALIINYCFALYWGYLSYLDQLGNKGTLVFDRYSFAYVGFGLLIIVMAVISFMYHRD